ncbi:MAG: dihydrodipicolinate synthase family protein [Pirellulaceae bacterium]
MADSNRITGILTPNIVPLDGRGHIDEQTLRAYVDWLIAHGVDGLYPNGSTGEFIRFTAAERRQIARIVIDQAGGRIPVLVGAAEANVRETIDACDAYGQMGAQAVAIVAPYYYKLSADGVYSYFREIADNVSVDVTLYNIPLFASEIDLGTIRRLAEECPRVVGIKDSSGDLPNMMRMIAAVRSIRPDFSFLTGWDASLAAMLIVGADGGTNASSGVVPELTAAIYRACKNGDVNEAVRLQYQLTPLFDAMIGTGEFPEGFRAGLRVRGWEMGRSRQPLSATQLEKSQQTQAKLQPMIAPHSSQHAISPATSPETIDAIVRRVLSELKA